MKKLFLSLAVVMSVSLFSCNGGDAKADSDSAKESATTEVVEETTVVEEETVVADSDTNKTAETPAPEAK